MKKFFFSIFSLLLLAGATGCSQSDEPAAAAPGPVSVSLSVGVDAQNGTRAFGDASAANTLDYAVYACHDGEYTFIYNERTQFDESQKATLDVSLAMGENYRVVFFAHCGEGEGNDATGTASPYTLDFPKATLTVDYAAIAESMAQGLKDYDCFYNYVDIATEEAVVNRSVSLQRPMAQINWGTKPVDDATMQKNFPKGIRTRLKATLYNKMNLLTGAVDPASAVDFAPAAGMAPITEVGFPVEGYDWLNSFYVLVPGALNATALLDASLEIWNGDEKCVSTTKVTNVPYGRNYRTNIFGSLITSTVGGGAGIDPGFGGDFNIEI